MLRLVIVWKPIVNQRNKNMKIINKQTRSLVLAMLLIGGLGFSSCSTGTQDGDVSVEKGDYKDKNPTEHNVQGNPQPSTDTSAQMAEPYEKSEGFSDRDADGKDDKAGGVTSEHKGLSDRKD